MRFGTGALLNSSIHIPLPVPVSSGLWDFSREMEIGLLVKHPRQYTEGTLHASLRSALHLGEGEQQWCETNPAGLTIGSACSLQNNHVSTDATRPSYSPAKPQFFVTRRPSRHRSEILLPPHSPLHFPGAVGRHTSCSVT